MFVLYMKIIVEKSKAFAVGIVKLCQYIQNTQCEFVLSKQLLRSGTSVGANVKEGVRGSTKPDFYNKMNIALKEASETEYWLELLYECDYIDEQSYKKIYDDCQEILKILMAITKTQNDMQ